MKRAKRVLYRALEILDYRTFVVATGFLLLLLVGYLVFSAFQSAHDANVAAKSATDTANKRAAAASRRIDLLNSEIQQLQALIAQGRDERGQLAAAVAALRVQVQQLGGTPVSGTPSPTSTVTVIIRPTAGPRPTASGTAAPTPSPTPSPSPGGVCRLLPVLC
jgi:hypothetical protein